MSSKYKVTGCARFFVALIILAPLAYLGASYYNGEDGIENVKTLLGIGSSSSDGEPATYEETEDPKESVVKKEEKKESPSENANEDSSSNKAQPVDNTEEQSNEQMERIHELTMENAKLKKDHDEILRRIKALEEENEMLKTPQDTTG